MYIADISSLSGFKVLRIVENTKAAFDCRIKSYKAMGYIVEILSNGAKK